jgi:pimeloyl-ACP methyl ester carboxylesterase
MNRRMFGLGVFAAAGCASTGGAAQGGSIDEGAWTDINGVEQWVAIRGRDTRNPILLFLHGGPGMGITQSMPMFDTWTEDFTVVLWDQPGSGATGKKHAGAQGDLSPKRYVADGVALADQLGRRFGQRRVVLMGISWGARLGPMMVRKRPDLFSVYVGTAQPVGRRGDAYGQARALEIQRERGIASGIAALEKLGPPPYATFEDFMVRQQYVSPPFVPVDPREMVKTSEARLLFQGLGSDAPYLAFGAESQKPVDMNLFMETLQTTFPERDWELRDLGLSWPIPVFVFQGETDLNAPAAMAHAWVDEIEAPVKAYEMIPGAGHNTVLFRDELLTLLRKHVLPHVQTQI